MSATQAQKFVDSLDADSDLDGDLETVAAERDYDLSTEEIRSELRSRIADDQGFHVDLDDLDEHRAKRYSCHTRCSVCPAHTCSC